MHYPIIQSSYSNLTGSGVNIPGLNSAGLSSQLAALGLNTSSLNQQTIPQVQYQDLGLQIEGHAVYPSRSIRVAQTRFQTSGARRHLHQRHPHPDQPPVHRRTRSEGRRKRAGHQQSQHAQEANAVSGLPGLSEIPGLQSTTNKNVQKSDDELVVLITPHVVRLPHPSGASQVMLLPTHQ